MGLVSKTLRKATTRRTSDWCIHLRSTRTVWDTIRPVCPVLTTRVRNRTNCVTRHDPYRKLYGPYTL